MLPKHLSQQKVNPGILSVYHPANMLALLACFGSSALYAAIPNAPEMNIAHVGDTAVLTINPIAQATGYKLYYAPYPSLKPIQSVDLGTATKLTAKLAHDHYLAVGVTAYNADGESALSNIDMAVLNEVFSGGETTIIDASSQAFSSPAPNLSTTALDTHLKGDAGFEDTFVTAPAKVNSGLGPLFNNTSCESCHPRDGRGKPPEEGGTFTSMFLRLSLPGADPDNCGGPKPVPGFGTQLLQRATFGVQPQAEVTTTYTEQTHHFADGKMYSLRVPVFHIQPYQPLPRETLFSGRVAPPVFGRGLLDAIPEATILTLADENDSNHDGISGKPNFVCDPVSKQKVLGRMGLKANNANVLIQNAGAYHGDIGITTPIFPTETAAGLAQDDKRDDDPELDMQTLEDVTFYTRTLAVPARRNVNTAQVRQGQVHFALAGCGACHVPTLQTGHFEGIPEISNQIIHPYTDMLLHDMGEGLADNRPDFDADGREWKTPSLWGIGLTNTVHNHTFFLHDGRARNLLEAIMWHGGEAENAKNSVNQMSSAERDALIAFLNSL